jgi:uncharacterized protein
MRLLFITLLIFASINSFAQPLSPETVNIEMRDEKFLAADVYVHDALNPRPTILIQTPYNKFFYRYGLPLGVGVDLGDSPYNFVIVDWRGFYASSSAAVSQPNRGEDGYDVIEWIVNQEWSNGKVGTWGPSALGKIQYETAREQHPAHICAVPLVASPEFLYQTYYPNGVYRTEYLEQLDALGYGLSATILANPHFNMTWNFIQNNNFYPQQINIPMLLIGGWYDHNITEMLKYFTDMRNLSDPLVRDKHKFLIGPWAHGGFGAAQVGTEQQGDLLFPEAADYSDQKALEFFAYYLLEEDNNWHEDNPYYLYFQMGDMTWQHSDVWPPTEISSHKFYLHENMSLSEAIPEDDYGNSTIVYDPRDPSPTIGGATLRQDLLQGPYDQAPEVESRDDILSFTGDILSQPIIHKGPVKVKLYVDSDRLDTDFVVRLCDVYPDNRSMLLTENTFRMRFRNGFTVADTSFMQTDNIYEIEIILPDIAHTFLPGHSIRINITSSNYPRFDNNLNNGGQMYVTGDSLIATNRVYHQVSHASYVEFLTDSPTYLHTRSDNDLEIFPNPAPKDGQVIITLNEIIKSIKIYDSNGKLIYTDNNVCNNKSVINTSNLSQGLYLIKVSSVSGVYTKKLVVK